MTTATHPWTFVHPACGLPAVHAARIPHLATQIARPDDFEHLDGRPVSYGDIFACESCRAKLFEPLNLAAMTVEANWRQRDAS